MPLLLALRFWEVVSAAVDGTVRVLRSPARRLGDYSRAPFTTVLRSARTLGARERVAVIALKSRALARVGGSTAREREPAATELLSPARVFALMARSAARVIGTVRSEARALADARRDPHATALTRAHAVNAILRKVVIVNE